MKMLRRALKKISHVIPDKIYISLRYRKRLGEWPNLNNPKNYNEKLQWLKLYDRNPEYTKMVDKYEAKKYIAEKVGEQYVIPTLGVWNSFDEIDFDALPNRFVLKCTHDSGGLVICRNKEELDIKAVKKKINDSLSENYYWQGREWPYKNVIPRIIAEAYLEEEGDDIEEKCLTDYKFFCFNGIPKIMYRSQDKAKEPRTDFFDMDYNHLTIRMKDPNSEILPQKPEEFETMKRLAEIFAKGHSHIRVDFYVVNKMVYVGELTFYHCSGFAPIKPAEWSLRLGEWIHLPNENNRHGEEH